MPRLPVRAALGRLLHSVRLALALKSAAAASAAWLVARQLPEPAPEYAFYAPLGAVVAMYPTIARSLRQAVQAVVAIGLGAALALGASAVWTAGGGVVAAVVGVGVLLGGLPWLGQQRTYVPIAGLFVLVIGQGHELGYAAVYAGLFLLGAAVTVAVNAAFPSLPLREADRALDTLRAAVSGHLEHLTERLREPGDEPLSDRGPGRPPLSDPTDAARSAVRQSRQAARGNVHARSVPRAVPRRYARFRALEQAVLLVEDLYQLLAADPWGRDVRDLPPALRRPAADSLAALAALLEDLGDGPVPPAVRARAEDAVAALASAVAAARPDDDGTLVMGALVTSLRRAVAAADAEVAADAG